MLFRLLADAVVLVHLAYIAFVVGGALLVLRWQRAAWAHLAAVAWGAYVEFSGTICPLTPLEQSLRARAGQGGYRGGFVEHYLIPLMYPASLTPAIQISLGSFVLLLNLVLYIVVFRARRRSQVG